MAKISAQCEYMTNAFPAAPLKLKGEFAVAEDHNGEHMIFTSDERGVLCLIAKGKQGHNELIDLSRKFGFSKEQTVRTLAVSQNLDGTIHLVFALQENGKADQLFVLRPMAPSVDDWIALHGRDAFYSGPQWDITIREILLVSFPGKSSAQRSNKVRGQAMTVRARKKHTPRSTWCFNIEH